ncbi:MAG: acyl-CoA dehydrogenase [Hyphomicrobiaceae bacterium]
MAHLVDRRHLDFVLDEVLGLGDVLALPRFNAHYRAGAAQIIDTAEQLAEDQFRPSLRHVDDNEPRLENGRVVLPTAIETALTAFSAQGFFGMTATAELGGLGLPRLVANAAFLQFQAANVSIANYALLSMSAAELLAVHATVAQQARYLAPMLEGRFFGTMALSEPGAGSSLGDITTSAKPLADGRYALRGTKMWISGGEHDMGENIVHLMLARIEGAAKGVKGLSLFIVPRKRLDEAGHPAVWNNIALAGLNHKMGQRGTVNTVLNIGEGGDCIGEIVGRPGDGLACMFTMMNEARIGVSMGSVAHASAAFQHALAYARERRQGRLPDQKDPASPQVPLVQHADVRRMLLQQKAAAEGGIAFGLLLAKFADLKAAASTPDACAEAGLLLDLLTPVFKAWISEECLTANWNAMQVLGGAGYTRDHPVELHYRDNRLNPIHEGTNGIQAIDLLGRKLVMAEGRAIRLLLDEMRGTLSSARVANLPAQLAQQMRRAIQWIDEALRHLSVIKSEGGQTRQLAFAHDVMELVGATTFAWVWFLQAQAATRALERLLPIESEFHQGLIRTCEFVFATVLPRAKAALDRIESRTSVVADITEAGLG